MTAVEDTLNSPFSKTFVATKITDDPIGESWEAVGLALSAVLPPKRMGGKMLVDAQQDFIPVRVVNLSSEPRKIRHGSK